MNSSFTKLTFALIVALLLVSWGLYFNALSVPFYLDDISSITTNPRFNEHTNIATLFQSYGMRVVGYISLWWDFEAAGLDTQRYHVVNNSIHALATLAVFALVFLLQKAAAIKCGQETHARQWLFIAAGVAVLFAVHPLQSQAVTYIVQRLASLTALFYLASLGCYVWARLTESANLKFVSFFAALLFALLAVLTKQNAVTLPLAILLIEVLFFNQLRVKHIAVLGMVPLLVMGALYLIGVPVVLDLLQSVDQATRENQVITRWDYFTAQWSILWVYISKVFYPSPLLLEYSFNADSFSQAQTVMAGVAHLILIGIAVWLAKRQPLFAFGVLFYYLAHAVESGVIPITDFAFEHRSYLPNMGLFLALVVPVAHWLLQQPKQRQIIAATAFCMIVVALGFATVSRNALWQEPKAFFSHEVAHNPTHLRTLHSIAELHMADKNYPMAMQYMNRIYEVSDGKVDGTMVNTHLAILINEKRYEEAITLGEGLLTKALHPAARAVILANLGVIYVNLQQHAKAKPYFDKAVQYGQLPLNNLVAYAYTLFVLNELDNALKVISSVLKVQPADPRANKLRTMILEKQG